MAQSCKLNPDDVKECSARQLRKLKSRRVPICDIYDEPISKLKKCPLK